MWPLRSHIARSWHSLRRLSSVASVAYSPVVIAGAGPSGLAASCLLSAYGVDHVVVERAQQPTQHPQAHFINNRTMEVFRGLGQLAQDVSSRSPSLEEWRRFLYCQALTGDVLGEVDHFPGQPTALLPDISPEATTHLSQHRLVPLMLHQATTVPGSRCSLLWGTQLTTVRPVEPGSELQRTGQQLSKGVAMTTAAAANDAGLEVTLQGPSRQAHAVYCQYLIAADGAHSSIRRQLGIPLSGEPAMQHLINIHFTSPQLGRQLLASGRAAMLYFVFNQQVVSVIVAHDLQQGEFVAQVPYFPPVQSLEDFTPAHCKQLLAAAAGVVHLDADIRQVKTWVMSAQVADRYCGMGGRVFLVGDAAHRFPPAGGFGMNTGIQDAHNLAWKLAAVLQQCANPQLLDTYQQERHPVALANSALSVDNWQEAVRVPAALGLDPRLAGLLHKAATAAPLPSTLTRGLLEAGLTFGRSLAAAVAPWRAGAVQQILSAGESLRLQFPKEDLGFCYHQGAVLQHGWGHHGAQHDQGGPGVTSSTGSTLGGPSSALAGATTASSPSSSQRSSGGGALNIAGVGSTARGHRAPFVPSLQPGCRMPHVQLKLMPGGQEVSSLDLVGPQHGLAWLLVVSSSPQAATGTAAGTHTAGTTAHTLSSPSPRAPLWVAAAQQLQQDGWQLNVLHIPASRQQQEAATAVEQAATCQAASPEPTPTPAGSTAVHALHTWHAVDAGGAWHRLWAAKLEGQEQRALAATGNRPPPAEVVGKSLPQAETCGARLVLVRPDGHVAWLQQAVQHEAGTTAEQQLPDAVWQLRHVLLQLHQQPASGKQQHHLPAGNS